MISLSKTQGLWLSGLRKSLPMLLRDGTKPSKGKNQRRKACVILPLGGLHCLVCERWLTKCLTKQRRRRGRVPSCNFDAQKKASHLRLIFQLFRDNPFQVSFSAQSARASQHKHASGLGTNSVFTSDRSQGANFTRLSRSHPTPTPQAGHEFKE